jgi:hypothetical protein
VLGLFNESRRLQSQSKYTSEKREGKAKKRKKEKNVTHTIAEVSRENQKKKGGGRGAFYILADP